MNLKSPAHILVILMSLMLLSYAFYKAIFSSFTHDECYSWFNYVTIPVSDIIFFTNCLPTPNNHVLNSILMKTSQALFGNHEWSLRLPNLLAYMFFLIYSVLWLRKLKNNVLFVTGIIVFHANAYLLDFFSIARGYGLSVSFIFISFFYLQQFFSSLKLYNAWLAFMAGALAVWSNFTGLHYYIALFLVYFIFLTVNFLCEKTSFRKKIRVLLFGIIPPAAISIVLYWLIASPLEIISKGSLIGSSDGFYQDTIRSIIFFSFLYDREGLGVVTSVSFFAIGIITFSACIYFFHLVKKKFNPVQSPNLLLVMIIIFTGLSTQFYFHFSGTPFLQNRTALLFIVLFNSCYMLLYQFLINKNQKKTRRLIHAFFFIYPVFLTVMFIYNFRPQYYFDWKYDSNTKEMLTVLRKDIELNPAHKNVSLGINWLCEPAVNYYRNADHLTWLNPVSRDGYAGDFDYYYVLDDPGFIENRKLEVIRSFPVSAGILARQVKSVDQ